MADSRTRESEPEPDPMETGEAGGAGKPPAARPVVGGMSTDADPIDLGGAAIPHAALPPDGESSGEPGTIGGEGAVGGSGGLDDGGTHGGGTSVSPTDEELIRLKHEEAERQD